MKRKTAEGDHNFANILERFPQLTPFLQKIFYLYRAFAKFSLSAYREAIQCYQLANHYRGLDTFALFNKKLAEGIVEVEAHCYDQALQYFNEAEGIIATAEFVKIDPYLYRAACHILKAKELMSSPTYSVLPGALSYR
jgi:tetratricopeptide (TPR) repeat protein